MEAPIRLRVVVPIVGLSEAALANRKEMLDRHKEGRTQVEFAVIRAGPSSIESAYDEQYAGHEVLREVARAEREGADAVIVWCADDPALDAARELVRIPVVGPGAASYYVAGMLSGRFTVISIVEQLVPQTRRLVEAAGLDSKLASVRTIDVPVLDIESAEEETFRRMVREAEAAIREDRAEAIVLGCMGLINLAERLAAHFREKGTPIPVVSPAIASLKVAEMLVSLGLSHSKLSYPSPRKVEGL